MNDWRFIYLFTFQKNDYLFAMKSRLEEADFNDFDFQLVTAWLRYFIG